MALKALSPPARLPRDALPGHRWPAIPGDKEARLWGLAQQLDTAQWLPAQELRRHQREQLAFLIDHACRQVPYYRDAWLALGLRPADLVRPEVWAELPVLTRSQLQQEGPNLRADRYPASHGGTVSVTTSGSTGKPVTVIKTAVADLFWCAGALRDHAWQQRDFRQKTAVIRVTKNARADYPDGISAATWGRPVDLLYETGPAVQLSAATEVRDQLRWLQRHAPGYLLTYPSNAAELARVALEQNIELPGLRQVRTLGESVPDGARDLVQRAWGVELVDLYSTQEVGYIALQCPDSPGVFHTQDETLLVEVLREDGSACSPGEQGRVVVTPLHNLAMPLLRYEVGDYARVGPPCGCGRGLGVLTEILGRVRNMLRLPGGGSIWPRFGSTLFPQVAPIEQYQFVQTALDRLEARVVSPQPLTAEECRRLGDLVCAKMGYPFIVTVTQVERIERAASGKFEEFRCDI